MYKLKLSSSLVKVFVYILFVYSGMVKWISFPLDPTLMFGLWAVAIISYDVLTKGIYIHKKVFVIFCIFIVFFLYSIISSIYSPSQIFWKQKSLAILLSMITLIYPVICFKTKTDFDNIHFTFKILTLTAALLVFALWLSGNLFLIVGSRLGGEIYRIPDYLAVGELLGIGIIFHLFRSNIVSKSITFFLFAMLIILGARGPFLFLVIVGTIYYSIKKNQTLVNLKSLLVLFLFGFSFLYLAQLWSGAELLIARLSNFSEDTSSLHRLVAFEYGLNAFIENPILGLGLGGFGPYAYQLDTNIYPHNILIEIGAELGIVGLVMFTLGISYLMKLTRRYLNIYNMQIYFVLLLFLILNYLKSGGLIDARKLFIMVGISIAYLNFLFSNRNNLILSNDALKS